MEELLKYILGPLGGLVVSLLGAWVFFKEDQLKHRQIVKMYEDRIKSLEAQLGVVIKGGADGH